MCTNPLQRTDPGWRDLEDSTQNSRPPSKEKVNDQTEIRHLISSKDQCHESMKRRMCRLGHEEWEQYLGKCSVLVGSARVPSVVSGLFVEFVVFDFFLHPSGPLQHFFNGVVVVGAQVVDDFTPPCFESFRAPSINCFGTQFFSEIDVSVLTFVLLILQRSFQLFDFVSCFIDSVSRLVDVCSQQCNCFLMLSYDSLFHAIRQQQSLRSRAPSAATRSCLNRNCRLPLRLIFFRIREESTKIQGIHGHATQA